MKPDPVKLDAARQNVSQKDGNMETPKEKRFKREYNWFKVMLYIELHLGVLFSFYLVVCNAMLMTTLFGILMGLIGGLGMTAGSHRLWAHNSYKANTKLKILLMLACTFVGQGTIYNWVRSHRVHHKYKDTEKDPYNSKRGFLYAHFISNIESASAEDEKIAKEIDMSDIEADSVVMFQYKYYWILIFFFLFLLPLNVPLEYWNETLLNTGMVAGVMSHVIALQISWLINSGNLIWGISPNDKYPSDSNWVFVLTKNYWPQYHYLAPWDYRTGEFGRYEDDCTTTFIRIFSAIGWATNLRTIDSEAVKTALEKSLDGNIPISECLGQASLEKPSCWDSKNYC